MHTWMQLMVLCLLCAGALPGEAPEGVHVRNTAAPEHVRMDVLGACRPRHACILNARNLLLSLEGADRDKARMPYPALPRHCVSFTCQSCDSGSFLWWIGHEQLDIYCSEQLLTHKTRQSADPMAWAL